MTNEVLPNTLPSPRRDLTLWRPEVTIRNEERKWKRVVLHLVRVPNLYFGSRLGAQYPKNSKIFL